MRYVKPNRQHHENVLIYTDQTTVLERLECAAKALLVIPILPSSAGRVVAVVIIYVAVRHMDVAPCADFSAPRAARYTRESRIAAGISPYSLAHPYVYRKSYMHMRSPVGASLPRAAQRVAVRISRSQPRQEFREFDLRWSRPWKRAISKTVYCRSWEERAVNQLSRFRISVHFIRFCRIASEARAVPLV